MEIACYSAVKCLYIMGHNFLITLDNSKKPDRLNKQLYWELGLYLIASFICSTFLSTHPRTYATRIKINRSQVEHDHVRK